jgi:2',3'-cyclic-nucleotide 2'-phosphodiesterase (5'-nucleotidase family)
VETLAAVYRQMNFDGVAVGAYDLAAGLDQVLTAGSLGVPWISANLVDEQGNLLFKPYRSVDIDSLTIAVIGLTDPAVDTAKGYSVIPSVDALTELVGPLSGNHDMIVLLSNLPHDQTMHIVDQFKEIDLVVGADPQRDRIPAFIANDTLIVQCGNRGMSLGFIKATWSGQPWGIDPEQERGRLMERLTSLSWQINRLKIQKNLDPAVFARKMEALQKTEQSTRRELAQLASPAGKDNKTNPSSFHSLLIPLISSTQEDPRIRAVVDEGKQRAVNGNGMETIRNR